MEDLEEKGKNKERRKQEKLRKHGWIYELRRCRMKREKKENEKRKTELAITLSTQKEQGKKK